MPHLLIVDANFYQDITDELIAGAEATLAAAGATWDRITVPGALEIPAAISMAALNTDPEYDGFVALGCVIRGETTHYETVCEESARAIMDLSVHDHLPIGNGILTVENREQAMTRALKSEKDKGGGAAEAALTMIQLATQFGAA